MENCNEAPRVDVTKLACTHTRKRVAKTYRVVGDACNKLTHKLPHINQMVRAFADMVEIGEIPNRETCVEVANTLYDVVTKLHTCASSLDAIGNQISLLCTIADECEKGNPPPSPSSN